MTYCYYDSHPADVLPCPFPVMLRIAKLTPIRAARYWKKTDITKIKGIKQPKNYYRIEVK